MHRFAFKGPEDIDLCRYSDSSRLLIPTFESSMFRGFTLRSIRKRGRVNLWYISLTSRCSIFLGPRDLGTNVL